MSLFDDIPLPVGTTYFEWEIIDWNPESQKYLVKYTGRFGHQDPEWVRRKQVEQAHSAFVMQGVEFREAKPGNSYNTRYFRSKT